MANLCTNDIMVGSTMSEWRELTDAFEKMRISWPNTSAEGVQYPFERNIWFCTKWTPTPWKEGHMELLSKEYPSALFYYSSETDGFESESTWFCNGENGSHKKALENRRKAYKAALEGFILGDGAHQQGVKHQVTLAPNGTVIAEGDNKFGECNTDDWTDICQVSCGTAHTVGLKKDGTVVACGSNINGQCNLENLGGNAVAISCGRYHTAVLLDSGKVVIRGNLEQEAPEPGYSDEIPLLSTDFPLNLDLRLNKSIEGWEKMNQRIENISLDDSLVLQKVEKNGKVTIEVANEESEKIGNLPITIRRIANDGVKNFSRILAGLKATVSSVTPISAKRKGSKYASMQVRVEYIGQPENRESEDVLGNYLQTSVSAWPPVVRIKSIFDAVAGVTADGKLYVYGFCPCTEQELKKIMGLETSKM